MESTSSHSFETLYNIALTFSKQTGCPFEEVAIEAFALHDNPDLSEHVILDHLHKKFPNHEAHSGRQGPTNEEKTDVSLRCDTWALIGPSGSGKSTFVNHLAEKKVAKEGDGINSETSETKTYFIKNDDLYIVDTPGLYDTRPGMNQEVLMKMVTKHVEEEVAYSSRISAIFLIWAPTYIGKFSIKNSENALKEMLGSSVLKSLVILVNKEEECWAPRHDKLVKELRESLQEDEDLKGIPVVMHDLKKGNRVKGMKEFKEAARKVESYNEEEFAKHRKELFKKVYYERIEADKKQEEILRRIEIKLFGDLEKWKAINKEGGEGKHEDIHKELKKKRQELRDAVTKIQIAKIFKRTTYYDRLCKEMQSFDNDIRFENGAVKGTLTWILLFLPPLGVPVHLSRVFLKPAVEHFLYDA